MPRTMPTSRWTTGVALGFASTLIFAAGCSKTDTATTGTTSPPASTAATSTGSSVPSSTAAPATSAPKGTTTTEADAKADEAAAEASLLTASDVPDGFVEGDPSDSDDENPFLGVAACAAYEDTVKESEERQTAEAKVRFDDEGTGTQLTHSVETYDDASVAENSAEAIGDADFPGCMEKSFAAAMAKTLPASASIDSVTITRNDQLDAADFGVDSLNGFLVEVTVTSDAGVENVTIASVFFTSGRALGQMAGINSDPTLAQAIVAETLEAATDLLVENVPS